jgi:NAD(P)-dependent dehydrogenase (short-subunit alcohol dehydrogenase family)
MNGDYLNLAERVAVVTGAGAGIGREIAFSLANAGASILAFSFVEEELAELKADMDAKGYRCVPVAGDVTKPEDVERMRDVALRAFGKIDILVNNAGVALLDAAIDTPLQHWNTTMNVNLTGPFLCAQTVAPAMMERRYGRIVNISSQAGTIALPLHAAYCASKAALNGLTRVLAIEWGPYGITCNAVAPTVVLTALGEKAWGDPDRGDPMKAKIPVGRFGQPWEIAAAVNYLASDAAGLVNGHVLAIDGGYTAQ